ncbi:pentatricopeptide repeat-containing protein At1g09900-like [Macadamia integrifolia]|uniref:pentatricopeptide repeat-containing protein At1g09900-like n=1 Tax=Macadamia integrifolia TaxID=60698 RepID=UPI001C4FD707|nr:pentatricopeptide repeat-containing protein At1g09900-like [Macadamia integrifolia]
MAIAVRTLGGSSAAISLVSSITSVLQSLKHQNPRCSNLNPSPLLQFSQHLNANLVIEVIKAQDEPHTALLFFQWASDPKPNPNNYFHTQRCYSAMVDLLLSHSMYSTALSILQSSNNLRDFMVGKFIKSYGDRGDIRGAIHWFDRAKTIESGRCLFSYNAILGVLVRANRMNLAQAIFDQILKERLVRPDVSTYTTMIRGYCKLGMIEDAKKVFDEMLCKPNLITYNTIIAGLCRKGLVENAQEIVDHMIAKKDSSCLPDTVTFTTLIDGYCKKGELELAEKCLDEMSNWNCEPNVLTYNSLINGLCLMGKVDEAKRQMTKMRLNGLKSDVVTHTSLLKGLCIVGRSDDAAEHLKEMIDLGLKLDVKSYGVVVNEYCKHGRTAEAIALLDDMKLRGINPSVWSFNELFRALTNAGEYDRAILVLKQMPQMGCSPNFLSYSTVICSLCGVKGRMRDVEDLVVDMVRRGHGLDSSMYSEIVKGHCEDGDLEMALGMFSEMVEKGFIINLQSFSVFVKELCGKGRISDAEYVFKEMIRRCKILDIASYRSKLNEYGCKLPAAINGG